MQETTYKYDLRNQLRQININGHQINFKYNTKGWRIKKDNEIRTTYYLYGKGQQVLEERNENSEVERIFIYGANGKVATLDKEGSINYVVSDQLGSTSVITDEEGNEVMRYKYSPFGNLIKSKGNTEDSYRFTGKEFDGMTGLYYYGARYYDPTIGRFITEDPIQDGWNWYVYCRNNPLRYVDLDGLTAFAVELAGAGQAFAEGQLGLGLVIDLKGDVIAYTAESAGAGNEIGAEVDLTFKFSPFGDVEDFKGTAIYGDGAFDMGLLDLEGGWEKGTPPNAPSIFTGGIDLGPTPPAQSLAGMPIPISASTGYSGTQTRQEFNIFDMARAFDDKIANMLANFWIENDLPSLTPSDWTVNYDYE
ncbi:RHS repeat domain-containing protein [Halobacteroides halobius]|uniref:RHS repeat domain-containing protein n=1 Tax=Halobacteroides halobius TaxID=42422 RepID=UPI0002D33859|nr:RHS repeat-associated core domain-containing protein [Halobacteroides halobius]